MHLAGYARVSILKDKKGLKGQEERIEQWGKAQGHDVEIFPETASAAEGKTRAVFDDLLERVLDGEYDGLVVEKLDRFGRSLMDIVMTTDRLREAGREFIAFGSNIRLSPDGDDPMTRLFFQLLAVFAEFERTLIRERLEAGKVRARAKGQRFGRRIKILPIKEIVELREKGASYPFLARLFGTHHKTIKRHIEWYEADEYPWEHRQRPKG